jgi:uncharacterized protein YjbJ (UPF0337 family)
VNHERLAGLCEQLAGKLQEKWGVLTRDSRRAAAGLGRQRAGLVRELRGIAREAAQRELREFRARHHAWRGPGRARAPVISLAEQRRLRARRTLGTAEAGSRDRPRSPR